MKTLKLSALHALLLILILSTACQHTIPTGPEPDPSDSPTIQTRIQGYYKDVFIDAGVALSKLPSLPAIEGLDLSCEFVATDDADLQNMLITGHLNDLNGVLLYPDGEPRFCAFYSNGGSSVTHGNSLGEDGRETIRAFYTAGGSYVGSCAGSALFSLSRESEGVMEPYYQIWPGRVERIREVELFPEHDIPQDSPLLQYDDFGNDLHIGSVFFNFGNYAREDLDYPPETEVLLRYDFESHTLHEKISSWAYKRSDETGRGVVIGCHPEYITEGEQLRLTQAMFLYALDGRGNPRIKGDLANNRVRRMNRSTEDHDPSYTMIGDRQVHHFRCTLPSGLSNLEVRLDGDDAFHLNLFVRRGNYAFQAEHDFSDETVEADKTIRIANPASGEWYIGVECFTTVQADENHWGYRYTGRTDVLNGVAYNIIAEWQ